MERYNPLKNIIHRKNSPWSQLIQAFISKHARVLFHLLNVCFEFHQESLIFTKRRKYIWENSIVLNECVYELLHMCICIMHECDYEILCMYICIMYTHNQKEVR